MAGTSKVERRLVKRALSAGKPRRETTETKPVTAKKPARTQRSRPRENATAAHAMGPAMTVTLPTTVSPLLSWTGVEKAFQGMRVQGAGQGPPEDKGSEQSGEGKTIAGEDSRAYTSTQIEELLTQMKWVNKGAHQKAMTWWNEHKKEVGEGQGQMSPSVAINEVLHPLLESRYASLKRIEEAQAADTGEDKEQTRRLAAVAYNVSRDIDSILQEKSFNALVDPAVNRLFEEEKPKEGLLDKLLKLFGKGSNDEEI